MFAQVAGLGAVMTRETLHCVLVTTLVVVVALATDSGHGAPTAGVTISELALALVRRPIVAGARVPLAVYLGFRENVCGFRENARETE